MKKIKMGQINAPDKASIYVNAKCYSIHLGNGIIVTKSTKRELESDLHKINEDLTDILFKLNEAYVYGFTEYRNCSLFINNESISVLHNLDNDILNLEKLFDLLSYRNHLTNGNYNAFKHLFTIMDILMKWFDDLISFRHQKRQFVAMRLIKIKRQELTEIYKMVANMGKDK